MRVADKIAVFKDGAIVQFGTPEEVYNNPVSIYVANFLGETTELEGTILQEKNQSFLIFEDIKIEIETDLKTGTKAVALIPAELADIHSISERESLNYDNIIEAEIISTKCVGEFYDVDLIAFNQVIKAKELIGKNVPLIEGSKVLFATDKGDFRVFPIEEDEKNEKEI
jgi:ABC-type Fe3+/spermidine/putrescine transport system ATPase subunit